MAATSFLSQEEIRTALLDALKTLQRPERGTSQETIRQHVSANTPGRGLNVRRWNLTLTQALNKGEIEALPDDFIRITQKGRRATQSREEISTEDLRQAIRKALTTRFQPKTAVHAKVQKNNADTIVSARHFTKAYAKEVADGTIEESSEGLRRKPKK